MPARKAIRKEDKRVMLYAYLPTVFMARLGRNEKLLLTFYAQNYNWTNQQDSYYSQMVICAYLGMAKGTYQTARKKLLKFGWITVTRDTPQAVVKVGVRLGIDDPAYDDYHWALWHPERLSKQNAINNFIDKHPDLVGEPNGTVVKLWETKSEQGSDKSDLPYTLPRQLPVLREDTNNEVIKTSGYGVINEVNYGFSTRNRKTIRNQKGKLSLDLQLDF